MKRTILPLFALIAMTFFQCSKPFALPFGKDLRVTQLLGQTVPNAVGMAFKFDEAEKKIMGKAGCNNFNVPYTLKGSKLSFGAGATTKMACPNLDWENKFFEMLPQVKSVSQQGSKILLQGDGGKTLAALAE
jgi:heat shock protein HslJ